MKKSSLIGIVAGILASGTAASAATLPLGANDWTTLYATFDRDTNAGQAKGVPYAAGSHTSIVADGVTGNALQPTDRYTDVVYAGRENLPGPVGTIRLFLKAKTSTNLWNDGKEHWIAVAGRSLPVELGLAKEIAAMPGFDVMLYKSSTNELVLGLSNELGQWLRGENGQLPPDPMPVNLRFNCAALDPAKWHEVIVSWDAVRHKYWLRVDEQTLEGHIPETYKAGSFTYLILTNHPNSETDRQGAFNGLLDELAVSDRPLDQWLQNGAPKEAKRAEAPEPHWPRSVAVNLRDEPYASYEANLRTYLDTQARMRSAAKGWAWSYHYPSGMGFLSEKTRAPYLDDFYNNAKDGSSTLAALRYAMAYEVFGDAKYLQVAEEAAATVLAAQQKGGWLPYWWTVKAAGVVPYLPDKAPIEDHTQTGPIFLFLYLHRLTHKPQYLEGATRTLDFLIEAQNPNGSWSHHYNVAKQRGEAALGFPNAGELNDYTTTEPMAAMLLAYRMTGEKRFLDSYMRGANWILSAFIDKSATGGAVGWAQQYDEKNNPIAARHFEPVALENFASAMAAEELMNAWRLTGDEKYRVPARKWLAWLKTKGPKYSFYHDIETGRPIVAEARKVYFLDDPDQVAAHKAAVEKTGVPYEATFIRMQDWVNVASIEKRWANLEKAVADKQNQTVELPEPDKAKVEAEMKTIVGMLAAWVPKFEWERGAYIYSNSGIPGDLIGVGSPRVAAALWTLVRARALAGQVPLTHPLLRMPYGIEPVLVVAPHLNLYAPLNLKVN